VKQVAAAFVFGLVTLFATGCHTAAKAGESAKSRDRANQQAVVVVAAPIVQTDSREPRGFALGAGDVLGERVFARVVAAARESEATAGYRFASLQEAADWQIDRSDVRRGTAFASADRAIFPAFDGTETHAAPVDLRDRWATVTVLRAERRPWLVDGREFLEPVETPATPQWPVASVLIPMD